MSAFSTPRVLKEKGRHRRRGCRQAASSIYGFHAPDPCPGRVAGTLMVEGRPNRRAKARARTGSARATDLDLPRRRNGVAKGEWPKDDKSRWSTRPIRPRRAVADRVEAMPIRAGMRCCRPAMAGPPSKYWPPCLAHRQCPRGGPATLVCALPADRGPWPVDEQGAGSRRRLRACPHMVDDLAARNGDAPVHAAGQLMIVRGNQCREARLPHQCLERGEGHRPPSRGPDCRSARPPEAASGALATARAIATRCCSPPDSSEGRCSARWPIFM